VCLQKDLVSSNLGGSNEFDPYMNLEKSRECENAGKTKKEDAEFCIFFW